MAMAMQIDDVSFRNLLLETQVLATKDHTKWQYDMILELLEGPLHNPKRLDESMRASKFMRRLLGFYHPFAYRYADLRNSRVGATGRDPTFKRHVLLIFFDRRATPNGLISLVRFSTPFCPTRTVSAICTRTSCCVKLLTA